MLALGQRPFASTSSNPSHRIRAPPVPNRARCRWAEPLTVPASGPAAPPGTPHEELEPFFAKKAMTSCGRDASCDRPGCASCDRHVVRMPGVSTSRTVERRLFSGKANHWAERLAEPSEATTGRHPRWGQPQLTSIRRRKRIKHPCSSSHVHHLYHRLH